MTFEVGQGVSGINPQGFMPRHGNEANFSCFFTFETLKCSISQNIWAKPYGFIRGIHVLLFNVTEKFYYLSPRHLNVTSSSLVPNFCNFSENRLFLDSNWNSIETVGNWIIFYFRGHFPIFQGDIEPTFTLLSSCKQMLQPFKHNVVWAFLAKKRRHQTLLYSGFSGKIRKVECLRRYSNRITTSYKCGTWLIRFVSWNSIK